MGTRLGRYEIIRTLARGALTDLLLGVATGEAGFQRHVALKLLREEHANDPVCLESFVNEARLAAALHHHNIVQVLDIGEERGQPFFAMEYVHGVDLRKLLGHLAKRGEQVPLQHVVSIVASAAAALHHAHEQRGADGKPLGIVHRQVTPANLIVGFDGNIKIVDFGIAKAAIKRMQTAVGVLRGSAPYMAPEQCTGAAVDRRSDVFALGIVLYELVTVRRLFKGANEFITMSAVVNAEVPRPSQYRRDIPPELEIVMLKALARDPAQRYQTAADIAESLDRVARSVGVGASTTGLANYMKLQFGERKEPWLETEANLDDTTDVDFDGGAAGLAPPPTEAAKGAIPKTMAATKSSPIVTARAERTKRDSAADTKSLRPSVAAAMVGADTFAVRTAVDDEPPRAVTSRAKTSVGERQADDSLDDDDDDEQDVVTVVESSMGDAAATVPVLPLSKKTDLALPPPPPETREALQELIREAAKRGDATAIVEPLHVVVARAQTAIPVRSRTLFWIGGGAALLVAIILVIALWPSHELDAGTSSAAPVATRDPVVSAEPAPTRSAMDMTARDYDSAHVDAGVVAVDAPPDAPEPVDAAIEVDAAVNVVEDIAIDPPPPPVPPTKPPVVRKKPAVKKPVVKKAGPTTKKKSKKPTWNPDELFLGD